MSFEPTSTAGLRRELENCETNLNHHLAERKRHDGEIARYEQVITGLKQTIELLDSPARSVKATNGKHGPRIRWSKQWPIVLQTLPGPQKQDLIEYVKVTYNLKEATANQAVNKALNTGVLVGYLNRCYLPGTEPRAISA